MKASRSRARHGAMIGLALLWLTACGSQESASDLASRSTLVTGSLDTQRVSLEPVSGQWRAVRLLLDEDFWGDDLDVHLALGVEASGSAQPYMALGTYVALEGFPGLPVILFAGFPDGESNAFVLKLSRDEEELPEGLRLELALVFGSNEGDARLHLGKLAPDETRRGLELLQLLAARPEQDHPEDAGRGGFVGSYIRVIDEDGSPREFVSGRMQVERGGPLPTIEGLSVLETLSLSGDAAFQAGGWWGLSFFSQPDTGLQDWSLDAELPPYRIQESGLWANAGPLQPPFQIDLLGMQPAGFFAQGPSEDGPASLRIERDLSGREGPTSEAVPAGMFASWGWVSTDFEALYGWNMLAIVPEGGE